VRTYAHFRAVGGEGAAPELSDRLAALIADGDVVESVAAREPAAFRNGGEGVTRAAGAGERDIDARRDDGGGALVAGVGEGRVGEGEDHPAVGDAESVHHVIAHPHGEFRATAFERVDADAERRLRGVRAQHRGRRPARVEVDLFVDAAGRKVRR